MKALRTLSLILLLSQNNTFGMWFFKSTPQPQEEQVSQEGTISWEKRHKDELSKLLHAALEDADATPDQIKGLLQAGADINDELNQPLNEDDDTQLHIVIKEGNMPVLTRLLHCVRIKNHKNKSGQTPFMTAVAQKEKHGQDHEAIVRTLINHLSNEERIEALEHAIEIKDIELIAWIRDTDIKVHDNNTLERISLRINALYGDKEAQEIYNILEGRDGLDETIDAIGNLALKAGTNVRQAMTIASTNALIALNNFSTLMSRAMTTAETNELAHQNENEVDSQNKALSDPDLIDATIIESNDKSNQEKED